MAFTARISANKLMRPQRPLGGAGPSRSIAGAPAVTGVGVSEWGICRWLAVIAPGTVDVWGPRANTRRSAFGLRVRGRCSLRFARARLLLRCGKRSGLRGGRIQCVRRTRGRWCSSPIAHDLLANGVGNSRVRRIGCNAGGFWLGIRRRALLEPKIDKHQQRREQHADGGEIASQGHRTPFHGTPLPGSQDATASGQGSSIGDYPESARRNPERQTAVDRLWLRFQSSSWRTRRFSSRAGSLTR
jgi:hypothetical protein